MNRRRRLMAAASLATLVALAAALSGGGSAVSEAQPAPRTLPGPRAAPGRPARCTDVAPGDLGAALRNAPDGAALCLLPGVHRGPFVLARPVTVWGPRTAVIRSAGEGTTVRIGARGAKLLGATVDGSGGRYDQQDAAVAIRADDVVVEGVTVLNAVFGILADRSHRVTIRGNDVTGTGADALGLRGDGIRLWETRGSTVADNVVRAGRDVVVWYSPGNRVLRNVVADGRYGTHLMYSDDNVVAGNVYRGNSVGVFVMYSHDCELRDNEVRDAPGGSSMGLGIKDSGDLVVAGNRFLRVGTGIFVDDSPQALDETVVLERNAIRGTGTGVVFHGRARGNEVRANDFAANREHVAVEGGGDATDARWEGNRFDDYAGYDLDGDDVGDVPYEARSLASDVTARHPRVAFFRGTAAFGVIDALGEIVPLFAPRTLLVDARPALVDPTRRVVED